VKRRFDVSDHAVLRWLERVEGVNVHAIRRRIRNACRAGAEAGAAGVQLAGVRFVLATGANGTVVVTTLSRRLRPHLAQGRRK